MTLFLLTFCLVHFSFLPALQRVGCWFNHAKPQTKE